MKITGVAHRGYPAKFAENSLPSFQAALDQSFSHIELDVQLSKDGKPVIMHDFTLNRMTNGQGYVKDYTLNELKQFTMAGGEQIPTLEEALMLLKGRIKVNIELKKTSQLYAGIEEIVLNTVRSLDVLEQVCVTSFDHDAIVTMRQLSDDIEVGIINANNSPAFFPFLKQMDASYLSMDYRYITPKYIEWCKEQHIQLIAWTINRPEDMKVFVNESSVLVCTDELERWAEIWGAVHSTENDAALTKGVRVL
ncbi:glycerophosphodiester phosphodiesterase [Marinicrinis lubricantis]|uniref:Glycerophosphodiester phosphodiesterase n=1 Tax=Marinicrinis lubricantis TaxID=2086470 RepID=A0ABW1INL7_9BACL